MFPYSRLPARGLRVRHGADGPGGGDLDHRHDLPRRPAGPPALHGRSRSWTSSRLLHRLDGGSGLIRQSEFFLYSKKDRQAVDKCRELNFAYPQVTGWIMARKDDFKLVKDMGLARDGHPGQLQRLPHLPEAQEDPQAGDGHVPGHRPGGLDDGIVPRCHFEDITRADFYGFVVPFAIELMKLREQYGLDVKIRLCDTLGFGVPWPQATLPRSVPKLVAGLIHDAGVPGELLEWHGHNDFHKVLVNPATAWLYGCSACNATLLGIGERTGNTPIEGVVIEAAQLRGQDDRVNYPVITEIGEYYREEIGYEVPHNYPLVGQGLQHHAGRHPRRRAAQERGDLQLLRHAEAAEPPRRHRHHRQERRRRHQALDPEPLPHRRGQGRPAPAGHPGEGRSRVRGRAHHGHQRRGNARVVPGGLRGLAVRRTSPGQQVPTPAARPVTEGHDA